MRRLALLSVLLCASAAWADDTYYEPATSASPAGFTNTSNALADGSDDAYATAAPDKNGELSNTYSFADIPASVLPSGATITGVSCEVEWKISATNSISTLGVQLYRLTTAQGTETTEVCDNGTGDCSTTDHTNSQTVTSGFSVSDLTSASTYLFCKVRAARGNDNQAFTASLDYVRAKISFTLPGGAGAPQVLEPNGFRGTPSNPADWIATGAATTWQALADGGTASNSEYMASDIVTADPSIERHDLEDGTDPAVGTDHVLRFQASKDAGSGGTLVVYLCQGTGTCGAGSAILECPAGSLTDVFAPKSCTLTSTQADSITDYTDLHLTYSWSGGPNSLEGYVSWAAMEVPGVATGRRRVVVTGGE